MAAASIGQVHRAVLRDGRQVAVKIQYPGVAQAIRDDLANTELLATFLRFAPSAARVLRCADLRPLAREIAARISEEVDYRHEAATIAAFSELYRGHPFIRVPEVIPKRLGDRVLTMTYLDGMDWAAAQQADQDLKNTWAEVDHAVRATVTTGTPTCCTPTRTPATTASTPTAPSVSSTSAASKCLPEPQRRRMVGVARAAIEGRKDRPARPHGRQRLPHRRLRR